MSKTTKIVILIIVAVLGLSLLISGAIGIPDASAAIDQAPRRSWA